MLSAGDLVRAVKDPRPDPAACEERGDVGKCMDWTGQSDHQEVDKRISSLYRPLSQPRVAVKSCLSEAIWDEERAEVTIIKNSGRQELGPVMPEEALFLLENNSLLLSRAAVPLSLQAAYSLLLSHTDLTLEKYLVYSKLTKEGFKLVRTNPEKVYCGHPESESVDQESEPDIDKNMIEPLYGVKLSGECSDWMQEIITDMADHIVGLTQSPAPARKRKTDGTSLSPERNPKQPRTGSEVVTLDDSIAIDDDQEQEAVEDSSSSIPKLYRNPFHEDSNSSEDEIIIEESVSVSSNTIKRGRRRRDKSRNIENINKTNNEILSSIRAQVTRVQEAEKHIPPIDDGPNSNLFSCEVCQISCNSEEVLENHKRGKAHQKKLNSADKKKHSCDICRIECTDASSLVMHLRGKKHLKVISSKIKASVTLDKSGPPEVMILEENTEDDEDIEIISQEKSKEEILSSLPDCSKKSNFSWNNIDIFSFVPKNTIELKNVISTLDVSKFFQSEKERMIQKLITNDPIAGASRRTEEEEILVLDDDDREPVTRPFRGFYPATQSLMSPPREGGRSPAVRQPTVPRNADKEQEAEESLKSLARRAEEWVNSRSVAAPVSDHVVDLGSSSSEDDDDDSSDYSDDVAAHSELRYFKDGPLASLWTFENKVGPLISPEMAGSVREIFSRLRMNPPERKYGAAEDDALEVTYDVHLAENYKKNSGRGPSYRLVIQHFQDSLPSPRALSHLDHTFPDPVPFLFAVVSGGTVCFFNMERVQLRSYYNDI